MNEKVKKFSMILSVILLILISTIFIKVDASPPGDTRIVIEHTHKTYIAPPCFEQAEVTNNLAEWPLSDLERLDYEPESNCTEEALKPIKNSIFNILLEKVKLKKHQWDW